MVDVTQHKVFPTIINEFQFSMDKQEHDLVIDELNDMESIKKIILLLKPQMTCPNIYQSLQKKFIKLQNIYVKNIHTYIID